MASMARGGTMNDATKDTPPVMVAVGADLIREAINCVEMGANEKQLAMRRHIDLWGSEGFGNRLSIRSYEADIARMEATAKALAEALPGGAA
jgi:hypothetical protein